MNAFPLGSSGFVLLLVAALLAMKGNDIATGLALFSGILGYMVLLCALIVLTRK